MLTNAVSPEVFERNISISSSEQVEELSVQDGGVFASGGRDSGLGRENDVGPHDVGRVLTVVKLPFEGFHI